MKKIAYRFKCLSATENIKIKLEQSFVEAYQKGYSPIEIAREAGMKSAKYIHAALVKRGLFVHGKPGKMSSKIKLAEAFVGHLRTREISFAQWCTEWGLEIEEAVKGIERLTGPTAEALKRDFPGYYEKLTGIPAGDFFSGEPVFQHKKISVDFDWDGSKAAYKAEIKGTSIVAYGDSYRSAFHLALINKKCLDEISRIDALPRLPGTIFEW